MMDAIESCIDLARRQGLGRPQDKQSTADQAADELAELKKCVTDMSNNDAWAVDEFNAGYQAFEAGLDVDSAEAEYYYVLPPEVPHFDEFRVGYAWAKFQTTASLEKFVADVLAVDAMNINVAAKWQYVKMLIDERKGT